MLLNHPFVVAVDLDHDDVGEESKEIDVQVKTEDVFASPRCPFEFYDWVSASSDSGTQYQPFERIVSLATDLILDWSVTSNWVTRMVTVVTGDKNRVAVKR